MLTVSTLKHLRIFYLLISILYLWLVLTNPSYWVILLYLPFGFWGPSGLGLLFSLYIFSLDGVYHIWDFSYHLWVKDFQMFRNPFWPPKYIDNCNLVTSAGRSQRHLNLSMAKPILIIPFWKPDSSLVFPCSMKVTVIHSLVQARHLGALLPNFHCWIHLQILSELLSISKICPFLSISIFSTLIKILWFLA